MGQYYTLYNVDKKVCVDAMEFDRSIKLMGSCYVGNPFVNAASALMAGPWRGDRVMYVGDYAWDDAMGEDREGSACRALLDLEASGEVSEDPYRAPSYFDKVDPDEREALVEQANDADACLAAYRFVANLDKRVYYDREDMPESFLGVDRLTGEDYRLRQDPLLIFLAVGCGLGGGDYCSEQAADQVGSWAADRIAVSSEPPEGFVKIASPFATRAASRAKPRQAAGSPAAWPPKKIDATTSERKPIMAMKDEVFVIEHDPAARQALLKIAREGAPMPYIVATGYDAASREWSQGNYFDDLARAVEEYKRRIENPYYNDDVFCVVDWDRADVENAIEFAFGQAKATERNVDAVIDAVAEKLRWRAVDLGREIIDEAVEGLAE